MADTWRRETARRELPIFDCRRRAKVLTIPKAHELVQQVHWQADGRHLVSVGVGGGIKVWELQLEPFQSRSDSAAFSSVPLAFSADGRWLAAPEATVPARSRLWIGPAAKWQRGWPRRVDRSSHTTAVGSPWWARPRPS